MAIKDFDFLFEISDIKIFEGEMNEESIIIYAADSN